MRTPAAVLLAILVVLAASPVVARGPKVLRCTDGARSCDADRTRNGTCALKLCERTRCACAPAGCCGARFCPNSTTPVAEITLPLNGARVAQETVPFGVGTVTVRCRKPAPPPPPSGYTPY